jgi:hypothetical protein
MAIRELTAVDVPPMTSHRGPYMSKARPEKIDSPNWIKVEMEPIHEMVDLG